MAVSHLKDVQMAKRYSISMIGLSMNAIHECLTLVIFRYPKKIKISSPSKAFKMNWLTIKRLTKIQYLNYYQIFESSLIPILPLSYKFRFKHFSKVTSNIHFPLKPWLFSSLLWNIHPLKLDWLFETLDIFWSFHSTVLSAIPFAKIKDEFEKRLIRWTYPHDLQITSPHIISTTWAINLQSLKLKASYP